MPQHPADRTKTAIRSPFTTGEVAELPILLLIGSADRPGPSVERRLIVINEEIGIGRRPGEPGTAAGRVLVLDDALISGRHAGINRTPGGWEVADLQSKNGTFVDGQRVADRTPLRDGALIFVGSHAAVFRLVSENDLDAVRADLARPLGPVATASPLLAAACDRMRRLAASENELLLIGETGVGKEVYARAVHQASGRRGRMVAINCAAIPRELVESELFGYRPGAHSTAHQAKAGLIEEAEGGTLFLDEVGEMSPEAQTKLLRFLQDRELTPLGGTRPRRIDVRVVAATSRVVTAQGVAGIRDDVVGRLGAAPIVLPPLRDRIEDLGALVAHFRRGASPAVFDQPAFRALCLHAWPLNVRELEKLISAAAVLAGDDRPIGMRDLPGSFGRPPPGLPQGTGGVAETGRLRGASPTAEQLEELLRRHEGNVAEVSRALGKHRAGVWRWLKKFGIGVEKYRKE